MPEVGRDEPVPNNRMNPTGPIGPCCIVASACVVNLTEGQVLHSPARRVMREPLAGTH